VGSFFVSVAVEGFNPINNTLGRSSFQIRCNEYLYNLSFENVASVLINGNKFKLNNFNYLFNF